jgi:hypothetical protein
MELRLQWERLLLATQLPAYTDVIAAPTNPEYGADRSMTSRAWSDKQKWTMGIIAALFTAAVITFVYEPVQSWALGEDTNTGADIISEASGGDAGTPSGDSRKDVSAETVTPAAVLYSLIPTDANVESATGFKQSKHKFECPDGFVLIGRFHEGDENGATAYRYAPLAPRPTAKLVVTTGDHRWSDWIKESTGTWFRAPTDRVLTGCEHTGDENGGTRYRTSAVYLDGELASVVDRSEGQKVKESESGWYEATKGRILTGRQHTGDENGLTVYETGSLTITLVR